MVNEPSAFEPLKFYCKRIGLSFVVQICLCEIDFQKGEYCTLVFYFIPTISKVDRVILGNMDRLSIVSIILTSDSSSDYFAACSQNGIYLTSNMMYKLFLFALYYMR